jgi:plastocyanin
MRRALVLAAAIGAAAILALSPLASGRATKTVQVNDDFYAPNRVKLKKCDKIAFDWVGINEHTVTKTKGPGPFFDSGPRQGTGVLYTRRFKKRGDYKLICTLHTGMTMKVEVKGG